MISLHYTYSMAQRDSYTVIADYRARKFEKNWAYSTLLWLLLPFYILGSVLRKNKEIGIAIVAMAPLSAVTFA